MSWANLNKAKSPSNDKAIAAKRELERTFRRCFTTEDGEKVLQHLSQVFIYNNDTPIESPNINYQAAYKNGEAGAIKYIINQMVEKIHVEKKET